jgi:hypothetical protein
MIVPMCAYTRGHDSAYVFIQACAGWCLYVHTRVGLKRLMYAYTRENDIAYVCMQVWE